MGKKAPKTAPSPLDFVTLPEEDQGMAIGNMLRKIGKDRVWFGDMRADRHTYILITILRHLPRAK